MNQTNVKKVCSELYNTTGQITVYRNLLSAPPVNAVRELLSRCARGKDREDIQSGLAHICHLLLENAEKKGLRGNPWQQYLLHAMAADENAFSRAAAKHGPDLPGSGIKDAAAHDLEIMKKLFRLDLHTLGATAGTGPPPLPPEYLPAGDLAGAPARRYREQVEKLHTTFATEDDPRRLTQALARFYHRAGCGQMGIYSAFFRSAEGGLEGIDHPDPVTLEDLIGYEQQKETVRRNTEAFLQGRPANNILLYGERGTGKSSTVKALANDYFSHGLRLVEVPKDHLPFLTQILREIRQHSRRFIIFIDDLSFESNETEFKPLKAVLEGGVETKPDNALIYATSNRRHLVQEKWADRGQQDGEIHTQDAVQEKLSLSDRFGITVTYISPDQEQYLGIVEGLARAAGVAMPREELREAALRWERWHNARSGRTARQFINHLLGTLA